MRQQQQTMEPQGALYTAQGRSVVEDIVLEKKQKRSTSAAEGIGERLGRLRKEKGITQAEMARLLGTAQPVVSDYERGVLRLHGDLIVRLADILGVSADELLGIQARPPAGLTKDRRLVRRLQEVDRLSKRDRDAVARTLDAFLSRARPG